MSNQTQRKRAAKLVKKLEKRSLEQPNISTRPINKYSCALIAGLLIIIFSVVAYTMTMSTQHDLNDKQNFLNLAKTIKVLRDRLQRRSPQNVTWSEPSQACTYGSGVGLQSGGWYCEVRLSVDLVANNQAKTAMEQWTDVVKSSQDILIYKDSDSYKDFLTAPNEQGSYAIGFQDKLGKFNCTLQFNIDSTNKQNIKGNLECGSGAHKSWYPNDEPSYSSAPDKDAWKN